MFHLNIPELQEVDKAHWQKIQQQFDNLIKPVGSLARLEDITCLYAAAQRLNDVDYPIKTLLLFVGGHAVADLYIEEGLQAEQAFVAELSAGNSSLNILANSFDARVQSVLLTQKFGQVQDITQQETMDAEQFAAAFACGRAAADEAIDEGARVLGLGCFAPGGSVGHAAMFMAAYNKTSEELGLEHDQNKSQLLAQLFDQRAGQPLSDLQGLVQYFGGYELPAMVGAIVQAASRQVPVFLDGVATLLAAQLACELAPQVKEYLVAVSTTAETGQNILLTEMQLSTMLDLKLFLPTGEASLFGFSLLDAGIKALREMDSFGHVHFPLGDLK